MDCQSFWRPPSTVRRNGAYQSVRPPPLPLNQQHQSSEAPARQRTLLTHEEELGSIPTAMHGQTSDVLISIPSDVESDGDDTEVITPEYDSERHIDTSQYSPSDDMLPSIEEITASIPEAWCGGVRMTERHEPIFGHANGVTAAESIQRRPLASQDSGDQDEIAPIMPVVLITSMPATPSAMPCSPTLPTPIQSNDALQDPVKPTAPEIVTTFVNADDARLNEPSDMPGLSSAWRCSSRSSATPSNKRRYDERRRRPTACTIALTLASTTSCQSYDNDTRDGEATQSRDALENVSSPDSESNCDLGSDSDLNTDSCPGSGLSHDEDYALSLANGDDKEQRGDCQANETDDDADEPPYKRRRILRSMSSTRLGCASSASPFQVNAKPSPINGHASTAVLQTPPPSQASIDKENEPDSAAFEEWSGTMKLTTINGVTSFEGQFEGELSTKLLQALVQTWSATQKKICPLVGGRAGGVRTSTRRGKFTPEEDGLIIELKRELNLPWADIHDRFSDRFPGRSKGALQVRYCTKLKR